jgi:hypothetical protein
LFENYRIKEKESDVLCYVGKLVKHKKDGTVSMITFQEGEMIMTGVVYKSISDVQIDYEISDVAPKTM